eukprot:16433999-Heterocapsa_arctica.AAC.1
MGTSGPLPGKWRYTEGARRPEGLTAFGITGSNCDSQYETEQQEQDDAPPEGHTDHETANRSQRLRNQMLHLPDAPWDMDGQPPSAGEPPNDPTEDIGQDPGDPTWQEWPFFDHNLGTN